MSAHNAIHQKMNQALAQHGGRIDAVFFCPHTPEENCACRKPKPGLMQLIGERYGVPLKGVPMVGDTLRDMQAGAAAGCPTHLIKTGKSVGLAGQALADLLSLVPGTRAHDDLDAFADWWIRQERSQRGEPETQGDSEPGSLS
jgi:D-glycero-D-manno-heptose 1,7-bisphosphate phosphatase